MTLLRTSAFSKPFFSRARVRKRMDKIRGEKKFGSASESIARELAARKIILPFLRKKFGRKLRAVLLVGSSQRGIRFASSLRQRSDIDFVFVIDKPWNLSSAKAEVVKKKISASLSKTTGVNVHAMLRLSSDFAWWEEKEGHPFQILFGAQWVKSELGSEYLAGRPELILRAAKKQKYASN